MGLVSGQVDRGRGHSVVRGDGTLQLATASDASAEAVGMEGDLVISWSSEETHGPRRGRTSRTVAKAD